MAKRQALTDLQKATEDFSYRRKNEEDWCRLYLCYLFSNPTFQQYRKMTSPKDKQAIQEEHPRIERIFSSLNTFESLSTELLSGNDFDIAIAIQLYAQFYVDDAWHALQRICLSLKTSSVETTNEPQPHGIRIEDDCMDIRVPILKDKELLKSLICMRIDLMYELAFVSQDDRIPQLKSKLPNSVPVSSSKHNIYVPLENERQLNHLKKCLDIYRLYIDSQINGSNKIWENVEKTLSTAIKQSDSNFHLLGCWEISDLLSEQTFYEKFYPYLKCAQHAASNLLKGYFPYSKKLN